MPLSPFPPRASPWTHNSPCEPGCPVPKNRPANQWVADDYKMALCEPLQAVVASHNIRYVARLQVDAPTMTNADSQPITITGVVENDVSVPTSDGSPGSALYDVPLQLSRTPSADWAETFVRTWDRPPSFSTMHRPGIASIAGDRIWLHGTTIEEIDKYHLTTLKLCVERTNELCNAMVRHAQAEHRARKSREEEHRQQIRDAAKRLKFD